MNCMRCGKAAEDKAVFCAACQEDMIQYPVAPGTVVHIPVRTEPPSKKPARKAKELSAEEQLNNAQTAVQFLTVCVLCLLTTLILIAAVWLYTISLPTAQPEQTQSPMGRNYTVTTPEDGG